MSPEAAVPQPSHAERARTLVEHATHAALSTLALDPAGWPYGSLVALGALAGEPLLLLSELAEHTRNLRADARASVVVGEPGEGDPLARGRVTLLGRLSVDERAEAKSAYLARQPAAARYAGFGDFKLWRLSVEAVRYIGGFGRMSWVDAAAYEAAEPDPLAPARAGILAHMNQDHADTLVLYCRAFSTAPAAKQATAAVMTAVDRYGFELAATTPDGEERVRLGFSRPLAGADEARAELVALAKRARQG